MGSNNKKLRKRDSNNIKIRKQSKSIKRRRYWNSKNVDFLEEKSSSTRKKSNCSLNGKYDNVLPKYNGKKLNKQRSRTYDINNNINDKIPGILTLQSSASNPFSEDLSKRRKMKKKKNKKNKNKKIE